MKKQYKFEKDTTSYTLQTIDFNPVLKSLGFLFILNLTTFPTVILPTSNNHQVETNPYQKNGVEWKISGKKKVQTAIESARLKRRLAKIIAQCLEDEDISPIGEKAIENFYRLIKDCDDSYLKGWGIFPNTNGTLSLEFTNHNNEDSQINIGYSMISYSIKNNETHVIGMEPFNVEVLFGLLKKVV